MTVEAFPDRRYKAVLRQVIPTADRTKATVQVKVTILDKDKDLKPEMSAKVTFLEPEKKQQPDGRGARTPVVLVPRAARGHARRQSVVFEVREGEAQRARGRARAPSAAGPGDRARTASRAARRSWRARRDELKDGDAGQGEGITRRPR